MNYRYGEAGDRWRVQHGDVWEAGGNYYLNALHEDPFADRFVNHFRVDLVYTDPPWGTAMCKAYRTKAKHPTDGITFDDFLARFVQLINRGVEAYVEMGNRDTPKVMEVLEGAGFHRFTAARLTYYKNRPCVLIYGTFSGQPDPKPTNRDSGFGLDDSQAPYWAIKRSTRPGQCVLDPCMGQGLTGLAAYQEGRQAVGIEMHPRRMAVALDVVARETGTDPRKVDNLKGRT